MKIKQVKTPLIPTAFNIAFNLVIYHFFGFEIAVVVILGFIMTDVDKNIEYEDSPYGQDGDIRSKPMKFKG